MYLSESPVYFGPGPHPIPLSLSLCANTPQFMHRSHTRAPGDGEVSVPQLVPLVEPQWPAPERPSTASDLMVHHFMCGGAFKKYLNLLLFFI